MGANDLTRWLKSITAPGGGAERILGGTVNQVQPVHRESVEVVTPCTVPKIRGCEADHKSFVVDPAPAPATTETPHQKRGSAATEGVLPHGAKGVPKHHHLIEKGGSETLDPLGDEVAEHHPTTAAHAWEAADRAYQAHHVACPVCIAAGKGYGTRCTDGATLWATYDEATMTNPTNSRRVIASKPTTWGQADTPTAQRTTTGATDTGIPVSAARVDLFKRRGLTDGEADALADKCLTRDREGLGGAHGMRSCLECTHAGQAGGGRYRCGNWRELGMQRGEAVLYRLFVQNLHRCAARF
jgi:hypothetical protein